MTFKDEVVKPADGDFSPFKQGWHCKTDVGAILNENLATLDQPGPRAPGMCAGLSAAFLIIMKNALTKLADWTMLDMVKKFKYYVCTVEAPLLLGRCSGTSMLPKTRY